MLLSPVTPRAISRLLSQALFVTSLTGKYMSSIFQDTRSPVRGTYVDGATTASVANGVNFLQITNTAPTTIENFTDGVDGQIITLHFTDSNTTINRVNCFLAGGANFTSSPHDVLVLRKIGGDWREVSRSVNS